MRLMISLSLLVAAWCAAALAAAPPVSENLPASQRPVIQKKGTIDTDLVETTPFVFKGKLYRLEWMRAGSYLRVMERDGGNELSRFGPKHRFPCAYVEGDVVYVVGTKEDQGWYGNTLTMFTSKNLKDWTERAIFNDPKIGICNTSICKAGERYVMSIELTNPGGFPARFLESKDLVAWTLMPEQCKHALGRYNAAHCLRWHDGWFYLFYLEAGKPRGYEQYVTRSRDLIQWHSSTLNPVLAASAEDKRIANPRLTPEQRARIEKAADVNNSDIDFCEADGRLVINYSWGNQGGVEFLAEAEYAGPLAEFLTGWFPAKAVEEPAKPR